MWGWRLIAHPHQTLQYVVMVLETKSSVTKTIFNSSISHFVFGPKTIRQNLGSRFPMFNYYPSYSVWIENDSVEFGITIFHVPLVITLLRASRREWGEGYTKRIWLNQSNELVCIYIYYRPNLAGWRITMWRPSYSGKKRSRVAMDCVNPKPLNPLNPLNRLKAYKGGQKKDTSRRVTWAWRHRRSRAAKRYKEYGEKTETTKPIHRERTGKERSHVRALSSLNDVTV